MRRLLVAVLVLVALAVVADRVLLALTENRVARAAVQQTQLVGRPEVDIRGWPFLTQALGGRYEEVRVTLTADDLDLPEGTRADLSLRGVRVPPSALLSGSVAEVPVERLEGTATLPYALVSDELGPDTTLESEGGDQLRISHTVQVAGTGVPLTAIGTVALQGQELVIDVSEATGAGVELPDALVQRATDLLDLRYPLPDLPFGLQVTGVRPTDAGVVVDVEGTDVVLQG